MGPKKSQEDSAQKFTKILTRAIIRISQSINKYYQIFHFVSLVGVIVAFSVIGGFVFEQIESPPENRVIDNIMRQRSSTLDQLENKIVRRETVADVTLFLQLYEGHYIGAIRNGTVIENGKASRLWTFRGSVYYCVTTFTLLGTFSYGNLAPKSNLGRVIAIIYSGFCVPICSLIISHFGDVILRLVDTTWKKISSHKQGKDTLPTNENISCLPWLDDTGYSTQVIVFSDTPHTRVHGDTPHTRVHGDTAHTLVHGDTPHTRVHGDTPHTRVHGDTAHTLVHGDTPHTRVHGDTPHTLVHGDTAHTRVHGDTPHTRVHGDTAHTLIHGDTAHTLKHGDTPHTRVHGDTAHTLVYGDTPHTRVHGDTAHTLVHGDTPHTRVHGDTAHTLVYGDTAHTKPIMTTGTSHPMLLSSESFYWNLSLPDDVRTLRVKSQSTYHLISTYQSEIVTHLKQRLRSTRIELKRGLKETDLTRALLKASYTTDLTCGHINLIEHMNIEMSTFYDCSVKPRCTQIAHIGCENVVTAGIKGKVVDLISKQMLMIHSNQIKKIEFTGDFKRKTIAHTNGSKKEENERRTFRKKNENESRACPKKEKNENIKQRCKKNLENSGTSTRLPIIKRQTYNKKLMKYCLSSPFKWFFVGICVLNKLKAMRLQNVRCKENNRNNNQEYLFTSVGSDSESVDSRKAEKDAPDAVDESSPVPILMTLSSSFVFVGLGSVFISHVSLSLSFFDSFWFIFISMLTIGYGDVVPSDQELFIFILGYIFIGLSILSNVINESSQFFSSSVSKTKSIGQDAFIIVSAKKEIVTRLETGDRARRRWRLVRDRIKKRRIPRKLIEESRKYKTTLLAEERENVRLAYKIYFSDTKRIPIILEQAKSSYGIFPTKARPQREHGELMKFTPPTKLSLWRRIVRAVAGFVRRTVQFVANLVKRKKAVQPEKKPFHFA